MSTPDLSALETAIHRRCPLARTDRLSGPEGVEQQDDGAGCPLLYHDGFLRDAELDAEQRRLLTERGGHSRRALNGSLVWPVADLAVHDAEG